ncbi:hypothetical protein PsalMR5_04883 (plasmid) [Piscirickettsia salmonis]|uniref:hypothetical protein n=1 Tax=Piscirickettsia salmonis TaxID=1238 RepID=UPI0012BA6ACD|nr:hypothetical protein [Piscirickettsia salmonis]QGP57364.1 hypothetical protein PsalSR1_04853 [Piscirickettsia salmonis]QGP66958.1 hypothetical protein PsalMR5_04883 [Piscirickettsia salmonis]
MFYLDKKTITITRYKPEQEITDGIVSDVIDKTFDIDAIVLPYSDHLKHESTAFNRKTAIEIFAEQAIYGADIGTNQPADRVTYNNKIFDVVGVKLYGAHWEVICIESDEYSKPTNSTT